jgi:hypothetical protein
MFYLNKILFACLFGVLLFVILYSFIGSDNKNMLKKMHYYNSLETDNAECDAYSDIKSNKVKLFFSLGETVELINESSCMLDYDIDFNFKDIPTYSRQYIGEGDLILYKIQTSDVYKKAYDNAVAYAMKYNKIIFNHYNKER